MQRKTLRCFILLCVLSLANCTLSPTKRSGQKSNKKTKSKDHVLNIRKGPQEKSVRELGLVNISPTVAEILENHGAWQGSSASKRNSTGLSLGYVTPWNSHGYDVAKIWAGKFTHVSPVWLQIHSDYEVRGLHDVDAGWIKDVRKAGRNVKLVPRVIFEGWSKAAWERVAGNTKRLTKVFLDICEQHSFYGLVVELWTQGLSVGASNSWLIKVVKQLGKNMQVAGLDLFLVVPPMRGEKYELFKPNHYDALYDHVTGFSLMTYDWSSAARPGPNAPLEWARACLGRLSESKRPLNKVLLGLNMYGMEYTSDGGGPIIAGRYIEILNKLMTSQTLQWDSGSHEHFFELKDEDGRHTIFYPTLWSISERLQLAASLDVGVAFWEIGQGLDYFYDLL